MTVVQRYSNGQQVQVTDHASINFSGDGMLLLDSARVTATAQQINALSDIINADGNIQLVNTVWEDLRFPAAGINPLGAASDPGRDTEDGRLVFSATVENVIAIQAQMPHGWKEGSPIRVHVHWSPPDANAGNVRFQLKYKIANVHGTFPAGWTTVAVTDAADGVADKHQIFGLTEIDMTGKTLSCMLLLIFSRLGADPLDTYASTIKLNELDIHYEIDTMGSFEEFDK